MNLLNQLKKILSVVGNESVPDSISSLPCFGTFGFSSSLRSLVDSVTTQNIIQDGPNADRWVNACLEYPQIRNILSQSLNGQTLVDLGASEHWEELYKFSKTLGVKQFIAVDKFWPTLDAGSRDKSRLKVIKKIEDQDCSILLVKGDALEFVSRLKDSSCCIALNGFDGSVVPSASYHKELAKQIERVVPKGGVAFGIVSLALSLIATQETIDLPTQTLEEMMIFSFVTSPLIGKTSNNSNPRWEDHSMIPFDRLLVRK